MPKRLLAPMRLVLLLAVSIFIVEFLLMMVLRHVSGMTELGIAVVDSLMLIVVLSPVLYMLFYGPLRRQILARTAAERELRRKNRELDLFVGNVSHSLRSTMSTIVGSAWFLNDKYRARLDGQDSKLLGIIEQDGHKVLAIIEDLVALSRLEGGTVSDEAVDVDAVVHEVMRAIQAEQEDGGCVVAVRDLPKANISRTHLIVMLDNLLRNALRYGEKKGMEIEVYGQHAGGALRLFVRDHGIGVLPDERERIFEVLYRGVRTKHLPGTGMGLPLVRKIARLYGGDVWVEETPDGGATFCLELMDGGKS